MLPATMTITGLLADATDVITAFGPLILFSVAIGLGLRFVPKIVGMAKGGKK